MTSYDFKDYKDLNPITMANIYTTKSNQIKSRFIYCQNNVQ